MAPDIPKVDADRHLDLGVPAWNFSDKVLRWLLHGKQSLRFNPDLLIPFIGTNWFSMSDSAISQSSRICFAELIRQSEMANPYVSSQTRV
jgi:hypothetical protein